MLIIPTYYRMRKELKVNIFIYIFLFYSLS